MRAKRAYFDGPEPVVSLSVWDLLADHVTHYDTFETTHVDMKNQRIDGQWVRRTRPGSTETT